MAFTRNEANGGDDVNNALERKKDLKEEIKNLKGAKEKLQELKALSDQAEGGDKEARLKLRTALRETSPEIVARCSDFARRGQRILAETMAVGEPLMEEAISRRLDLLRAEGAGEDPTPLEVLLTERIVSAWLVVEVLEALLNAQLKTGEGNPRTPPSYLKFIIGWLESYQRRYLAAIKALAQVRRLQSGMPSSQTNVQINLASSGLSPRGPRKRAEPEEDA
jgi:hypothetical protein